MFNFDTFTKKVSRNIREGKSISNKFQLITEVVDSKRNREAFYQKYCQLTIDLNELQASWHSDGTFEEVANLPENELLKKEGLFILKKLYENKIYVNIDSLGPIHDMMLKSGLTAYFKPIKQQFYATDFYELSFQIQQIIGNKYVNPELAKNLSILMASHSFDIQWRISNYNANKITVHIFKKGFLNMWTAVHTFKKGTDALFAVIVDLFNKRRAVLPKKDLFQYANNLYDLVAELNRDLNTYKSKKETEADKAPLKDLEACIIYRDSKVIVLEPKKLISSSGDTEGLRRAAEMSHKYFGIFRQSLVTGATVPGANWCTAASPEPSSYDNFGSIPFLKKYLFTDGNNLYYFIDLREDKIYALRTAGNNVDGDKLKLASNQTFRSLMLSNTIEVLSGMGRNVGSVPVLLRELGLDEQWAQQYIKFINIPDSTAFNSQKNKEEEADLV